MNQYELESLIKDLDSALTTLGGASCVLTAREIRLKSLIAVAHREAMEVMQEEATSRSTGPTTGARELV